ncbi:MAG: dihydroxy-acid dehydratase [Candidatus Omnitrophota bacterium]|nr:dihydroxy-acid dehydratase [Candidatus Omnitrophota bacterium]
MRSDKIKRGVERAGNRALLYATGLTRSELTKPFIGIVTSNSDIIPGHIGMKRFERFIERGVAAGGGVPFIFGVPGICDGIAMGHSGMKYSLPSRELIADMVETIMRAHSLDGLVCLTNCDKITPGMMIAVARLNIPSIVVTAGPMLSGSYKGKRLSLVRDTFEAVGRFKKGEISQQELSCTEMEACPGFGSCQGLYTANSMACIVEAMGMSMPGCGTALAVSAKKDRIAFESGERVVNLVRRNVLPGAIMSKKAIENAIIVDMAMGGSSNTVLHIKAIASELGIDLPLKEFDRFSRQTSHIVNLRPGGDYFMEDLEAAGGIPAVLKRLQNRLNDVDTVSGKKLSKIARECEIYDTDIIRPLNNPYHKEGGMAILYGNLCPDGAVVKQSAVSKKALKFRGKARVFDSEESAMQAILNKRIGKGDVIVIRYEGPKGGPGMREMLSPTSSIVGMGLSDDIALITDGRFSGGTKGPCIGHISPEAAVGGPLAVVRNDDVISINIPDRKLELKVSGKEIENRLSKWEPPKSSINEGYLKRYARLVTQASEGAILK